MFAIGIRYLCGRAVATNPGNREQAEWPPHPDRVFMALAAAHFETDGDAVERHALEWLEQQNPPAIAATAAGFRASVTAYVPVNDVSAPTVRAGKDPSAEQVRGGLGLLPDTRPRQPRQFPAAIPDDPVVHLIWSDAQLPANFGAALESICRKVTYVGHSSSLVQAWVTDTPPAPLLAPTNGRAQHRLRITGGGRLAQLVDHYRAGQRPSAPLWIGYNVPQASQAESPIKRTVFDDDLIVFRRVEGPTLGLESTLQVTAALRGAVMQACPVQPVPEWMGGHKSDGTPSETPHLAFLPLPHVGRDHADGHLLGVAVAVPRQVSSADAGRCLDGILGRDEQNPLELQLGRLGVWVLESEDRENPPVALKPAVWTSPAMRWASVTPIVFDRHPKGEDKWQQAEETIAVACERIGLPRPRDVILMPVSCFQGAPHGRRFPYVQRKGAGGNLHLTHAVITFEEPVRGPVLLGAGRYRGYGLCRP